MTKTYTCLGCGAINSMGTKCLCGFGKALDTGSASTSGHYNSLALQPIEISQYLLTPEEFRGFLMGNIIKYAARAGLKSGESTDKELNKVKQYSHWLELTRLGITIDPRKHTIEAKNGKGTD